MQAKLISLDYDVPQCDTTLNEFPVVIGQADDAGIHLDDYSVDPHHCRIVVEGNRLVVSDLGSVHGTFVNNSRIAQSPLMPGDELAVGMLTFLVQFSPKKEVSSETLLATGSA